MIKNLFAPTTLQFLRSNNPEAKSEMERMEILGGR